MNRTTVLLAVCMMFFAASIQAQAPQGPPKPGPEVKDLDYNVGTWKVEGEAKPFGPMPGGKFTSTEKCEWYSGGFFVMCHSEGTGPMGLCQASCGRMQEEPAAAGGTGQEASTR